MGNECFLFHINAINLRTTFVMFMRHCMATNDNDPFANDNLSLSWPQGLDSILHKQRRSLYSHYLHIAAAYFLYTYTYYIYIFHKRHKRVPLSSHYLHIAAAYFLYIYTYDIYIYFITVISVSRQMSVHLFHWLSDIFWDVSSLLS